MDVKQFSFKSKEEIENQIGKIKDFGGNFALIFGGRAFFEAPGLWSKVKSAVADGTVLGCSTAGEIGLSGVSDDSIQMVLMKTHGKKIVSASTQITSIDNSASAGKELASKLPKDAKAVFVLSPGTNVNGSALVEGMRSVLNKNVVITGGLAGDGAQFTKTYTLLDDKTSDNTLVAVAFTDDSFRIGYGSMGGWKPFGPVRKITKAQGSTVFEIDGEPALDLYKKYLGAEAEKLPGSGLLYPFAILKNEQDTNGIVRTILAVDEKQKSLTFAGDIATGAIARLMHTDNLGLTHGAKSAAELASKSEGQGDGLAILISCVGRKLVMGSDIEDEIDAVKDVFGSKVAITGFYSYGELCPQEGFSECKLHNQTMTITYINMN